MVNPDAFSALKSIFKSKSDRDESVGPYSSHGVKDKNKRNSGTTSSPPHSHPAAAREQLQARNARHSKRYSGRPVTDDGSATLVGLEDKVLAITKRHADTHIGKAEQKDDRERRRSQSGSKKEKGKVKSVRFNEEVQVENPDALRWADDVGATPDGKVERRKSGGGGGIFSGSLDANIDHLPPASLSQIDGTTSHPSTAGPSRRVSVSVDTGKKTIWKEDFTKIIRIRTGPPPTGFIFEAYHSLLYRSSSYYSSLITSHTFDPATEILDLTQIDSDIFALYLTYLTTGSIEAAGECVVISPEAEGTELRGQMHAKRIQLIECYICAEKVGDKKFANYIMDALLFLSASFYEKFGPPQGLGRGGLLVFEKTKKGSKLRKLEVEIMFSVGSCEGGPRREAEMGERKAEAEEFWCEVARCGMKVSREGGVVVPPWEGEGCRWHDHEDMPDGWSCS